MELNKKTIGKILFIITFAVVLLVSLENIGVLWSALGVVMKILSPFLLGLCMAFILNVPMRAIETRLFAPLNRRFGKIWSRLRRPLALVLSVGLLLGLLSALMLLVIPQIQASVVSLAKNLPGYMENLRLHLITLLDNWHISSAFLQNPDIDWTEVSNKLLALINENGSWLVDATVGLASALVSTTFNIVLGFVFSLYILCGKEKLAVQMTRLLDALLPDKVAIKTQQIARMAETVFSRFVVGQFTEAILLGILCYVGMLLFSMPYAAMISALVGFTALIPVFGALIGTAVGAFLILLVEPIQAVWFVLFIIILQQLEGNLLYPKVVGRSVGLPGLWVLLAVTVGGSLGGALGMLIGVPLGSVLYGLLREFVQYRLKKKGSPQAQTPTLPAPKK